MLKTALKSTCTPKYTSKVKTKKLNYDLFCSLKFVGSVSLLSINRYQDVDSTLSVTPCGDLILSLTKRDHDRLGLEGIPMKHKLLPRFGKLD